MKLNYKNFEIEIVDDPTYILNSVDNLRKYKKIYTKTESQFHPTSRHAIIVNENDIEISSAIICETGGSTSIHENSFIIEDDKIWICACNKIYCLEIPSLELRWQKEIDSFTNFSIYKIEDTFLIHGELQIFRITKEGEILWDFGGRDIWVNIEGKPEITIEKNLIRLFDFESNEYVIDFDGKEIEFNPKNDLKKGKKKSI
jgi:outer membrane protein assembly factor BamB